MSASPLTRQTSQSQSIPSRHMVINDASQLPVDYSTTPGGTLYSTTPGGTRIVYERNFLMNLRNSPLARTPPKNLSAIPGILASSPTKGAALSKDNGTIPKSPQKEKGVSTDEPQFQMDI